MNRERLTMYEEVKIIVALEMKVESMRKNIEETELEFLKDMYRQDIQELQTIINKLI